MDSETTSAPSVGAPGAADVDHSNAADCPRILLNARLRRVPPSDMILDFPATLPVTTRRTLISPSLPNVQSSWPEAISNQILAMTSAKRCNMSSSWPGTMLTAICL